MTRLDSCSFLARHGGHLRTQVALLFLLSVTACAPISHEQRVLQQFVSALSEGDFQQALSFTCNAEIVTPIPGLKMIYFKAVPPKPILLPGVKPSLMDDYPFSLSQDAAKTYWKGVWVLRGSRSTTIDKSWFPNPPPGAYLYRMGAKGACGFVKINGVPKIWFIDTGP